MSKMRIFKIMEVQEVSIEVQEESVSSKISPRSHKNEGPG